MTSNYKSEELKKAQKAASEARQTWETAKTKTAKRHAAEELEFWTNRTAFLAAVKADSAVVGGVTYDIIDRRSLDDTPRVKQHSGAAHIVALQRPKGSRVWSAYENADGTIWGLVKMPR